MRNPLGSIEERDVQVMCKACVCDAEETGGRLVYEAAAMMAAQRPTRKDSPMQSTAQLAPKYLFPTEGERLTVIDSFVTFKAVGTETGDAFTLLEGENPPGTGVPLHLERYEDETFYVLEGTYEFVLGDEAVELTAGGFVHVTRGTPHAFRNLGDSTGRVLCLLTPGGIHERFMRDLAALGADGMPEIADVVACAERYGIEFLPPRG
jgi:quercetin dioxygenase-like cupin family protein